MREQTYFGENCCHDGGRCGNATETGCSNTYDKKPFWCKASFCTIAQRNMEKKNPEAFEAWIAIMTDVGLNFEKSSLLQRQWQLQK